MAARPYRSLDRKPHDETRREVPMLLHLHLLVVGGSIGASGWVLLLVGSLLAWKTDPIALPLLALPGLLLIGVGIAGGNRLMHLLVAGRPGRGQLVHRRALMPGLPWQRLSFDYPDEEGRAHRVTVTTPHEHLFRDERREPLLYDPARPDRVVMIDALPGRPRRGEARGSGLFVAWLLLPIATVVANVACMLAR